jgi:GntR family transcriptional regulator
MAIWIQILPGAKDPIYAQIVEQVARAIASGQLAPGDRLPAVRTLAGELVINPNTAARAYGILEQQGLVHTRTGCGTFVADPKLRDTDSAQLNILNDRIDNIITQAINLGISHAELDEIFKSRQLKFKDSSEGGKNRK